MLSKHHPPGSLAFRAERSHFPPGPSTAAELFLWPNRVRAALALGEGGPNRVQRLRSNLASGVATRTHYSGKGTFESVCTHLNTILESHNDIPAGTQGFHCSHACDKDPLCRRILLSHKHNGRNTIGHVYGDMMGRVDPEVCKVIDSLIPAEGATPEEQRFAFEVSWIEAQDPTLAQAEGWRTGDGAASSVTASRSVGFT